MNILLLGATGQVGYATAAALARTEHRVTVLVRDASKLHFPDTVNVIERAAFSPEAFNVALRGIDHVIYCIGLPEQFQFDTEVFDEVNCGLLASFLEAMRTSGARRLTYLSTYEVFETIGGRIDETHAVADERAMTPYSQSKVRAYRTVLDFARRNAIQLTTIHPAAVYGGLSTGDGITTYMENLARWRWFKVPFVSEGMFPVVHIDSLTNFMVASLERPGAYIVSDQMTSLPQIAQTMRRQARTYAPLVMPIGVVKFGVFLMEALAKAVPIKPLFASVQIDFIARGWAPDAAKATRELGFKPMPLDEGCRRTLATWADLSARREAARTEAHFSARPATAT